MKKLLSILLALAMMMSLFGVAALADEEAEEVVETEEIAETVEIEEVAETLETEEETAPVLTILLTGEVGLPAAEESEETEDAEEAVPAMGYASMAALKEHYAQEGEVVLVDVGGFVPSAVEVMEAAGYDLAVTDETMESETLVALAPVAESISGMMMNKGDKIIAFIGINVPAVEAEETGEAEDGEEADETDPNAALYDVIQASVDKAADADYVILVGLCADVKALAENVTGADAIFTTGEGVETIEKEDETSVLVVGAEAAFGTVGVVTIDAESIAAEVLDAEGYTALELTENEAIAALEAAWIEEVNKPVEEQPEETAQPEEPEQTDSVVPTPAVTPATIPGNDAADDGEETPVGDGEEAPADGEEAPADDGEEAPAGDGEEAPADGEEAPADDGEEAPAGDGEETPADDGEETPAGDGEETPADGEETPADDEVIPTPEVDTTINWSKGTEDLKMTFESRVSGLKIGGNTLVEGSDYSVGEGGNIVFIAASMLNGWPNGKYEFVAIYPDGSQGTQLVNVSGEAPEVTTEPDPTATPEPTAEPTAEPTKDPDAVMEWSKGTQTLKITFENRVSQLKVGGNVLVEGSDYTVTDEGNTVIISAEMMNGWPNAKYSFTAIYPDGSQDSRMVKVTGDYKAPVEDKQEEQEETNATATPAPTKTPEGTPNTGDTSPILLYVIILVILVIALVVVLVMTGKKNRRR